MTTDKRQGEGRWAEAIFAGGCFWCVEAVFKDLKGVHEVVPGYTGGHKPNPTYQEVCSGTTGHAEAVRILYDPDQISYRELLEVFFTTHDPTQLNRQGPDVGTQYRSAIFVRTEKERQLAEEMKKEAEGWWGAPVVTEIVEAGTFWPAEDYHRDYFARHPDQPYCAGVVAPKVAKARQRWRHLLKDARD
ncbi:MAG: peptide-methionine (S)-S-oxide reductase [Alphaproteobacteria bacterium]|nr:MAG: peptide-methionine (S)-S-oxide reductase [Alphaproteobacteria bacterium]